jgi:hypothetical protein
MDVSAIQWGTMSLLWPELQTEEPSRWARVKRVLRNQPSAFLLAAQLGGILMFPFLEGVRHGRVVVSVFSLLVLTLAMWTVRSTPALTWVSVCLGLPALILEIWSAVEPENTPVFLMAHVLLTAFYLYTGYGLIAYMFADHWVTRDDLFALGAAFTVFAWAFAYLFLVVQTIWPNSFASFGGVGEMSFFELLHLSIANMTSVGLSDVIPVRPQARSVVMIEHIAGVLYVTMVISRLVALTVMRGRR